MILKLFSICDKAAEYIVPYPGMTNQAGIRQFATEINNNPLAKDHAEDFSLFYVGDFETTTGVITQKMPPEMVASGIDVLKKE